jgi:hypothetical protein
VIGSPLWITLARFTRTAAATRPVRGQSPARPQSVGTLAARTQGRAHQAAHCAGACLGKPRPGPEVAGSIHVASTSRRRRVETPTRRANSVRVMSGSSAVICATSARVSTVGRRIRACRAAAGRCAGNRRRSYEAGGGGAATRGSPPGSPGCSPSRPTPTSEPRPPLPATGSAAAATPRAQGQAGTAPAQPGRRHPAGTGGHHHGQTHQRRLHADRRRLHRAACPHGGRAPTRAAVRRAGGRFGARYSLGNGCCSRRRPSSAASPPATSSRTATSAPRLARPPPAGPPG